jgi:Transposase DNA-binding/Transposase DDE domain
MLSDKSVHRVGEIFSRADLGDARLVRRASGLAEALALAPNLSLPKVWASPAELEAGYSFLRKPRAGFSELMQATQQNTRELALTERRVLALHDTTDVTCPAARADEVGFLQTGKAGFYVHHTLCVGAASMIPLGVVWSELWGRPQRTQGRARSRAGSEFAKLEVRESDRWLEGVAEAQLWLEGCEQVVHVMDREADSYRLFQHMLALEADFVVRLRHDRRVEDGHLADVLAQAPSKLLRTVHVSARPGKSMPRHTHKAREAREAELVVRCSKATFQPPNYMRDAEPVELNVVQILEEKPPLGEEPISWVLVTTLPIHTREQLEQVIDIYRARWLIEEFHKALKTGCMLEKRQLESFESITTLLALCYPVASELLRVRTRSRQPGLSAADALRPSVLACLRAHPRALHLPEHPSAQEALASIARLGGHLKHNGPPGWQTLAAGYMELLAFERGWLAAKAAQKM